MLALDIQNICKTFTVKKKKDNKLLKKVIEKKEVLKNCSFSVKEGSIFGLVGLNGIGKTTLIKIILDMLTPDSGSVLFFGRQNLDADSRKNICYLPEKFMPSQYLTGYEFLSVSLSFFGKKLDKQKAQEMAEKLDLDKNVLQNVIGKYSKGMGQKLGLLSCLLSDAKLLILDEPMSGLDPKSRIALKEALKEYASKGNAIFFSSHILEDIGEICDTMDVLHNSNTKFIGSPVEFREKFNAETAERAFLNCIS
jgi:ABC-2 type transport system ATP-binding protein